MITIRPSRRRNTIGVSGRERNGGGIFIAPVLGGEARMLSSEGERPRFSPDGQKLLYFTAPRRSVWQEGPNVTTVDNPTGREIQVWVRPVAGGPPTQLANGCRVFDTTLVWSSDSSRVLFLAICGAEAARVDL